MRFLVLSLLFLNLLGCGSSLVSVSGQVSYDRQLIEQGEIRFVPAEPRQRGHGAAIAAGEYSLELPAGNYQVQVTASRPVKATKSDPSSVGMREDFIPAKYNTQTTLKTTISADQNEDLNFELSSK